jgi:cupin fold WbuC family metalloprotein
LSDLRFDPTRFQIDPGARSLSFWSLDPTVGVDQRLVDTLAAESKRNSDCNARVCLHTTPASNFHEMVILERRGYYYPPHKHLGKAQSCNILRGQAAVFVFDDEGNVTHTCVLGQNGNLIFRIGEYRHHLTLPLTEFVIYHECKPGPFVREGDSIYAEWAPKREDAEGVAAYVAGLRQLIT